MRAFFYFHLVRLFGEVPYLTEPVTAINRGTSNSYE